MPHTFSPETIRKTIADLVAVGDQLEANNNPDWLIVARAAGILTAMQQGHATIQAVEVQHAH